MGDPPKKPADPIMAPIEAQRDRIEKDGPDSLPSDHLAHAQRAYLYALHAAAGALAIAIPLTAIVIPIALHITRPPTAPKGLLLAAFSCSVLVWFLWARTLRMLIAADPAYRISTPLFIARKSVMPAALVGAFAAGVLLAPRIASTTNALAPAALMLALAGAASIWITLLTAWRTRSLLSRCANAPSAVWSDIGAIILSIAALATLFIARHPHTLLIAALLLISLLASTAIALALVRLRTAVGAIMRDIERAEPGPAFEPVGPGS